MVYLNVAIVEVDLEHDQELDQPDNTVMLEPPGRPALSCGPPCSSHHVEGNIAHTLPPRRSQDRRDRVVRTVVESFISFPVTVYRHVPLIPSTRVLQSEGRALFSRADAVRFHFYRISRGYSESWRTRTGSCRDGRPREGRVSLASLSAALLNEAVRSGRRAPVSASAARAGRS